tara:strand:+ start:435 stop:1217 length:783 start_codon:yes stop_codon:yes gene_type:complete
MRIALSIEYNGSKYFGWQRQKFNKTKTIQYHVDRSIGVIADEVISTTCAGRTDTGVHAFSQIVHFDTTKKRKDYKWIQGINSFLPADIIVKALYHVDDDFHARYQAIDRTYRYIILNQDYPSSHMLETVFHFNQKIDLTKIKSTFKYFKGEKDYSCFRSSGCSAKSPIKHIKSIKITKQNNLIYIDITANSFLYHMVRNIVGALLDVGISKKSSNSIREIINSTDRKLCGKMVPASGLYLMSVSYPKKYKILSKQKFNLA